MQIALCGSYTLIKGLTFSCAKRLYEKGEDMSKDKPSVYQHDLIEMMDRQKLLTADLQDFAIRNEADVVLRVSAKGEISMQVVEKTNEFVYYKQFTQKDTDYKYEEARNKK